MRLFYVRHGHSSNNTLGPIEGRSRVEDPPLTPLGLRQVEALCTAVRRRFISSIACNGRPEDSDLTPVTHIYSSLMQRALVTATRVAEALAMRVTAWPDTHEVGGIYRYCESGDEMIGLPGNDRAHFEARFPDLLLPYELRGPWWNRPFEEVGEAAHRAARVLSSLTGEPRRADEAVILVGHRGFYNLLLAVMQRPARQIAEMPGLFELHNCAISRIDLSTEHSRVVFSNDATHLGPDLLTPPR
ncbi:MAG: histidine phosphatase family protein [Candidatus Wallbacteria bacterium]|nr:histidine phosphatase family protein [Candidatus Wallbacteria bacterium]